MRTPPSLVYRKKQSRSETEKEKRTESSSNRVERNNATWIPLELSSLMQSASSSTPIPLSVSLAKSNGPSQPSSVTSHRPLSGCHSASTASPGASISLTVQPSSMSTSSSGNQKKRISLDTSPSSTTISSSHSSSQETQGVNSGSATASKPITSPFPPATSATDEHLSINYAQLQGEHIVEMSHNGRYGKLNTILGKGAYKVVWKAVDLEEGIEVAWNSFQTTKAESTELSQEIEILTKVRHPNIICFKDSWYNNGEFVFITELMTSGTLREYIQKLRKPSLNIIKRWSRQILKGLLYLHSHQPPIIHRDIKCDNIFINGTHGEVKIGDMGTAKMKFGKKYTVIGTPEFMAPEMYEEKGYSEKVDVYAFGMCLLEMVTGDYPYSECKNAAQIYKKVSQGIKPDCLSRVEDEEILSLINNCITSESERYSVKQVLDHSFLMSEPEVILLAADETKYALTLQLVFKGLDKLSVKFEFNLETDTPEEVVHEMIEEKVLPERFQTLVTGEIKRIVREFYVRFPASAEMLRQQFIQKVHIKSVYEQSPVKDLTMGSERVDIKPPHSKDASDIASVDPSIASTRNQILQNFEVGVVSNVLATGPISYQPLPPLRARQSASSVEQSPLSQISIPSQVFSPLSQLTSVEAVKDPIPIKDGLTQEEFDSWQREVISSQEQSSFAERKTREMEERTRQIMMQLPQSSQQITYQPQQGSVPLEPPITVGNPLATNSSTVSLQSSSINIAAPLDTQRQQLNVPCPESDTVFLPVEHLVNIIRQVQHQKDGPTSVEDLANRIAKVLSSGLAPNNATYSVSQELPISKVPSESVLPSNVQSFHHSTGSFNSNLTTSNIASLQSIQQSRPPLQSFSTQNQAIEEYHSFFSPPPGLSSISPNGAPPLPVHQRTGIDGSQASGSVGQSFYQSGTSVLPGKETAVQHGTNVSNMSPSSSTSPKDMVSSAQSTSSTASQQPDIGMHGDIDFAGSGSKEYEPNMPIDELVLEVARMSHRSHSKAAEWITKLRAQDIMTVGDLRDLHEEDWASLNLTVFASRALKNALCYGKYQGTNTNLVSGSHSSSSNLGFNVGAGFSDNIGTESNDLKVETDRSTHQKAALNSQHRQHASAGVIPPIRSKSLLESSMPVINSNSPPQLSLQSTSPASSLLPYNSAPASSGNGLSANLKHGSNVVHRVASLSSYSPSNPLSGSPSNNTQYPVASFVPSLNSGHGVSQSVSSHGPTRKSPSPPPCHQASSAAVHYRPLYPSPPSSSPGSSVPGREEFIDGSLRQSMNISNVTGMSVPVSAGPAGTSSMGTMVNMDPNLTVSNSAPSSASFHSSSFSSSSPLSASASSTFYPAGPPNYGNLGTPAMSDRHSPSQQQVIGSDIYASFPLDTVMQTRPVFSANCPVDYDGLQVPPSGSLSPHSPETYSLSGYISSGVPQNASLPHSLPSLSASAQDLMSMVNVSVPSTGTSMKRPGENDGRRGYPSESSDLTFDQNREYD